MYAPPTDLDERQLVEAVEASWDLDVSAISYEPVGFGTHHYVVRDREGSRWFVNVDDLEREGTSPDAAFDAFARAFGTARVLRDAGLEFVLAPVAATGGEVVARLGDRYAVSVVPYLDGSSSQFGEFTSAEERRTVLSALGRLHAASDEVPADFVRREDFEIPLRRVVFEAIGDVESPWLTGPFGEPCRCLLAGAATSVRESFARYDEKVDRAPAEGWVITHGEPHAANVIRTADGALHLIDWDTTAVAPRERDLWMVEPQDEADWEAYGSSADGPVNSETIDLYRLAWDLAEVAIYTDTFRRPHVDDANTRVAWKGLQEYLSGLK